MPFTGQLGGTNSQLGNVVLGGIGQFPPLPFGFTPHVLDAITVRVQFNDQVDDSALNPSFYSILAVSGPVPNFVPSVASVSFYDADHRSVALTLNQAMTFTTVYSLSIIGVKSPDGNSVTPSAGNFRANVPDSPRAIAAFLSQRGMIDIYFDRSVGPNSFAATATIEATVAGSPQPLTLIPWGGMPVNAIRFELNPAMDSAASYTITFSNVVDDSYNQSSGQVPLTLTLQAPLPYSYAVLGQPQVIDAWVDSISNAPSGYGRTLIDVFFNCPMDGPQVTNVANWMVTSNGSPVTVLSVINWCSVATNDVFVAVDSRTYFAQVAVAATLSTEPFLVQVQAQSEDHAYSTSWADYTGTISVAPLATPPRNVGTLVEPLQASLRFNQGINLPSLTTLTISGPNGFVQTTDVVITASIQALVLAMTDLMESFNQHNMAPYGAGHLALDIINHFAPSDFPSPSLSSAIVAVNKFKTVYLAHASSTAYHNYADPDLITSANATDLPSAVALAQSLISSFMTHNVNVGVHTSAGVPLFSAKLFDTLDIGLGMLDAAPYLFTAQSQYFFIDVGENRVPTRCSLSASFIGLAESPYVASAIPRPGLVSTNNGVALEQDAIIVYFSKPIQPSVLAPTDIVITGATVIGVEGYDWVNSRVLNISVTNMATAQYSLDILGVQDPFGNVIVSV